MSFLKQSLSNSLIAFILVIGGSMSAFADTNDNKHILSVSGTGTIMVQPDSVQAAFSVVSEEPALQKARSENAERMGLVIQKLKALQIPGLVLKTVGYRIYPVYEPVPQLPSANLGARPKKGTILSYRIQNQLEVVLENQDPATLAERASTLVDTDVIAGANYSDDLSFYIGKSNPSSDEALKLAVAQAKHQADIMAQAAGVTLTGISTIQASGSSYARRPYTFSGRMQEAEAKYAAPATPIESGTQEVNATVQMGFEFQN